MVQTAASVRMLLPKIEAQTGSRDLTTVLTAFNEGDFNAIAEVTASAAELNTLDGITANVDELNTLDGVTATAAELNDNDLSLRTQAITEAGAIDLDARHVTLVGPGASTYAVTLAAPTRAGIVKVIEMLSTTSTNAVTLALTNVVGGSQSSSASFDAAGEILVLVSASLKWVVLKERGVTLS